MKKIWLLMVLASTTSCSVYQQGFDCEPKKGVGCKSVSEIEGAIIEKSKGEDLFSLSGPSGCKDCPESVVARESKGIPGPMRVDRVWIAARTTPEGNQIEGHYVYFPVVEKWTQVADLKSLYEGS